jgi:8-oxo-dGTP diphosphatase
VAKKSFAYEWPRPALTVDMVVFTVTGQLKDLRLQVLLIERDLVPFRGHWALPGGFVREDEDLDRAAARELAEETGVHAVHLEQVGAIGTPGRDPRGHVVTIVYVALVAADKHELASTGDARAARWFDVAGPAALPPLAFDHHALLNLALEHLRSRVTESGLVFELLPETFALSDLQALYEVILGAPLDRRNFRRKLQELGLVAPARGSRREGRHRPAQLFRFVPQKFKRHASQSPSLPF